MKKKLIMILGVCLALTFALAACSNSTYSRNPVSGGPAAGDAVTNNGSFIVQKGDYYYYINGKAAQSDDNTFNSVVKGAIVRCHKNDLEDASKHVVIVPKIALNSYADAGFSIFGEYIYFTSPNDEKDKDGNVQSTYLDFMRAKLDGSAVDKLFTRASASVQHKFYEKDGKVYIAYIDSSIVYLYDVSAKTVSEFVTEYTGTPLLLANGDVLYTEAVYYELATGNEADIDAETYNDNTDKYGTAKYNSMRVKNVFTGVDAQVKKDSDATKAQFSYTLSKTEVSLGTEYVYFTKSEIEGGTGVTATCRSLGSAFAVDTAVIVSTSTSLGTFLTAPNGMGYITQGSSAIIWTYVSVSGDFVTVNKTEKILAPVSGSTLLTIREKNGTYYLYYFNSSSLERITLPAVDYGNFTNSFNSDSVTEEAADTIIILGSASLDTMDTAWIRPVYFADRWFFFNSASNAYNKTGDKEGDEYKHVSMYYRNGYLFAATEVDGEDYEDNIVPPVRIGILSDADKDTEETNIESENNNRDADKFDAAAKKVFDSLTKKVSELTSDDITQEMKDLIADYNALAEEIQDLCDYKSKTLILERKIKALGA